MSKRMNKNWLISNKINEAFIKKHASYSEVVLQLLYNRGIKEEKDIKEFLSPDMSLSHDPFLFNDMEAAVKIVIDNIKKQNSIMIYGDYDADGVTSSALLYDVLTTLKASADVYIPDRVKEGYGLNKKAIDFIKKSGASLVITVDNGIRGKEVIDYAKSLGLEVIVTDHHIASESKKDLPDCPVINPIVLGEKYPFKYLAGVGVAFKLAEAIIKKSKLSNEQKDKLIIKCLDLVAIGTVADMVTLKGENRVLAKNGLEILNKTKRPGLKELIKVSGSKEGSKLESWNIGYQIGPRLNAAGRMDHANTSFEILKTKDKLKAKELAIFLNERNIERQKTTEEIIAEADEQVKNQKSKILTAVSDKKRDNWSEGVIGLAASRITNKYYRPTIVITKSEGVYKGSGRSIEIFDLIKNIEKCSDLLDKFGGHPQACGITVSEKNLNKFITKIKKIADAELDGENLSPIIKIDVSISLEEVNENLLKELDGFAPFGQNNPQPIFKSKAVIMDIMTMGLDDKHIKLKLKDGNSKVINALGFNQNEKWKNLEIGDKIEIAYTIDLNEFNGRSEVQMKIEDIKHAS